MAQHMIPTAQLVPQYKSIGRCNNYAMLQSIPCSPECKIVRQILLDHPLSSALTATADFLLDTQQFTYTVDMFRDTLHLSVETLDTLFVAPTNIHNIEAFMNRVGYQGVVDKVSAFFTKNLAQPWQTMFKVFNRCLTTRTSGHDQTKINILQLFHAMVNRTNVDYAALLWLEEDYHFIKDDVPLVSVYTMGNFLVCGMLISDAFLTTEIRETNDFKEYETVFMKRRKRGSKLWGESSSSRKSLKVTIKQKEIVDEEKDDVDSEDRLETGSHKENLKVVDDDDDNAREKKDDTMGSLEIRNEEMQTTISTPIRSPRKSLSSDKNIFQELKDTVSIPITTTSKHSQVKKRISSKYSHLPGALCRMCRRQGYMIQDIERKCVTTKKFWETHNKVDQVLKEVIPEIAENVVNDLIEYNLKPCIAETIIEDRDAFRSDIPAFVSQEFKTHAPKIITELFKDYVQSNVIHVYPTTISSTPTDSSVDLQYQLYLKMKCSLQDRADNITLWEALRRKFEKSSTSNISCREDDIHSHHDEHHDNDAPPEGEKRVKRSKNSKRSKSVRGSWSKHSRKYSTTYVSKQQSQHQEWNAWEEENVVDKDEVIPEDVTLELITEFQNIDKRVPTIFDHARIEATLRDSLSNMSINAKEYAYHLEQSTSFMENQIYGNTEEKKYILSLHKIHAEEFPEPDLEERLDFIEQILVMRANDKPDSFSESDFKYLNKNDIKDLYYLCRSKEIYNRKIKLMNSLITFIRSCVIWERVHDFQLRIESYQMKVNLTAPTLTFLGIEEHAPYTIFSDATLEKVLNEVKLRMFESKFLKKPPLLSELDQDIMKAYEREISKRLSHRQQMRRWESFMNERPILPMMKRL
ncbi:hypothetical protein Tco_0086394 [Tanacetum coccineum]